MKYNTETSRRLILWGAGLSCLVSVLLASCSGEFEEALVDVERERPDATPDAHGRPESHQAAHVQRLRAPLQIHHYSSPRVPIQDRIIPLPIKSVVETFPYCISSHPP